MTAELTPRQAAVLAFMRTFFAENDHLPGGPDISRRFGFTSPNAGADYIAALRRKGYIERNTVGKYRFTRQPASTTNA